MRIEVDIVCVDAGEGGGVKSDGAGADEDGGRSEDLDAVVVLGVAPRRRDGRALQSSSCRSQSDWAEFGFDRTNFVQDPMVIQTQKHDSL